VPSGFKIGNIPASAAYRTRWPAMVTVLVVNTGLCVASGIVAASFFAGALVAGELVGATSAARRLAVVASSKIQASFFILFSENNLSNHRGNGIAHFARADFARIRLGRAENVAGAVAGFNRVLHGAFDRRRRVVQAE